MTFKLAYWVLFLLISTLIQVKGDGTIEANVIRLNTMDDDGPLVHHHDHMHQHRMAMMLVHMVMMMDKGTIIIHGQITLIYIGSLKEDVSCISKKYGHHTSSSSSSSSTNQKDPRVMVFFMLQDLQVGKTMPIHFPNRHTSSSQLLSKQETDKIPFSLAELPNLLRLYSFSQGSPQAEAMESTLRECEVRPIKGETKRCPTSLESVHEFSRDIFGSDTQVITLATTHLKNPPSGLLQNYKVIAISQNIPSPKLVACHTMPYAYTVFYCHSQESENKVLMVTLEGEDGDVVEALSVCHMDTSQWSRSHISFSVLGVEPGETSVCHFFPSDNFVLIPSSATM
ncbi:BURP domain-containing protein BNM2C-like [Bidens hawaiensis]|uniref:BURP domain-containing protein BNM2C-like n=1 Tax=Bidens hawaiensis TaxID=980011 RepID=UPI00404922D1